MALTITPLSAQVLQIIEIFAEASKKPAQEHEVTAEEMQLIADFQNPGVQAALTLGLTQLRDALAQDLASKGYLPGSIAGANEPPPHPTTPATATSNAVANSNYYPNACYDYTTPTNVPTQNLSVSPPPQSTPPGSGSPPRSGANRRPPSKRKYETTRDSPFTRCQWGSCGQAVENSSESIISHLVTRHRIDLTSRNGTMLCHWDDCGEDLLITSFSKHITSTHLRLTVVECPHCPDKRHYCRMDSLNAHIKAQHPRVSDDPSPKKPKIQLD